MPSVWTVNCAIESAITWFLDCVCSALRSTTSMAVKDGKSKPFFEHLNAAGNGGLGDKHFIRGAPEAAELRDA